MQKVELGRLPSKKRKPKVAGKSGRGLESVGAELPTAAPPRPLRLKGWCRGGRGAERAAAVAAARLPAPEHAREPPRSPPEPPAAPPAAPRAQPPGEPGTGQGAGGRGSKWEGKDGLGSGWSRGLRCGVAAATAPGSRRPRPGSPPRAWGARSAAFLLPFAQIARTRRQSLGWPAGGRPWMEQASSPWHLSPRPPPFPQTLKACWRLDPAPSEPPAPEVLRAPGSPFSR